MSPDIEQLLRDLAPRVLGVLVRRFGDFALAEDAVQEALLAAATQWPSEGLPENPGGWLFQVGSRKMTDLIRTEQARRRRENAAIEQSFIDQPHIPAPDADDTSEQDDTLIILFMCCHPAVTRPSAIALTLRAAGGLSTAEIASAFLVPEATMAQRISRAKQTIKKSGAPFGMPSAGDHAERLSAVLHVLYLMFNEGYATSGGSALQRVELATEAIRLTRMLRERLPKDEEVAGMLALMLLTDARRAARSGPDGELIPLDEQDRSLWNRGAIEEGTALITATMKRGAIGPYQLQAAIAALHDEAASTAETDWPQILALYTVLERVAENPMVTLNRAIAVAMVNGAAAGLELLATLDSDARMAGHYRLDAVRAHLLELGGDRAAAIELYRAAAGKTLSVPERNYLITKAAKLAGKIESGVISKGN